jgi:hypothetical protein
MICKLQNCTFDILSGHDNSECQVKKCAKKHLKFGTAKHAGPRAARGQGIGIWIGMLPQTLIVYRLDQFSRLGARI